jgi:hypothetical protein
MKKLLFLLLCIALSSCATIKVVESQTLDQTYLGMHNPLLNGASCTNITLASAITALGSEVKTVYLTATDRAKAPCTWQITGDVVVPSNINIHVPFGVIVNVAAGVTFTFNGPVTIESPDSITGDGSYVFSYPQDAIDRSYVIQDCLSTIPSSSLTLPAFQCLAKIKYGNKSFEVRQDSAAVGPITVTTGVYWIAMHWNTTATVAGWTRQAGTKYLWRAQTDAPDIPDGMVLLMRVVTDSSVIALVGDIRPDTPNEGPVNARSRMFGVVRDCVANDTVALQKVFNNAMWRGIAQVAMPAALPRDCYRAPDGLWLSYHSTLNFNHPGNPLNLTGLVWDGHLEILGSGAQFFSSLNSTAGGTGTVIEGTTGPVLRAKSEHNVNGAKNIALRNLTVKGTATDPTVFLIDFDAVAGVVLDNVACKQRNFGGSCVRITDYDRPDIRKLVIDGPDTWNEATALAAGGKGLVMSGIDVDNSGGLVQGVHVRGFDRAFELGNIASGADLATAHSLYGPITLLSCNDCFYISGTVTHSTFAPLQINGAHVRGLSIGDGARNITFSGGAISGAANPANLVVIGRDGTEAQNIFFDNMDFLQIYQYAFSIDSTHSLTANVGIKNSRFHCQPAVGTLINFVGNNVRGGYFSNNVTANCSTSYAGVGTFSGFDYYNTLDKDAPEFSIKEKMRIVGVVGASSGIQGIWSHSETIDFGVVPASDCTAWVPFTLNGINTNNYIWPIKRPASLPAKVIIEGDITDDDEVSIRLCNIDDIDSADPASTDFDLVIMRIGP